MASSDNHTLPQGGNISLPFLKTRQNTEDYLMKERLRLNEDIAENIGLTSEGQRPLNVVVIGTVGVAKSSCINTMITAMSEDYYKEYILTGRFDSGQQMTYQTTFCQREKYMKSRTTDLCYPTFIDIAGFQNEDTKKNEELLRLVFDGCLPKGTSLKEVEEYCQENGIKAVRNRYQENKESRKIDRVIVIASAREEIPENLINCVVRVANPPGVEAAGGKRVIPVFGILAKIDTIDVKSKDFLAKEQKFFGCMGLHGAKHRYARLINYCNDVDDEDERLRHFIPTIDVPTLRFLSVVLDPMYEIPTVADTTGQQLTDTAMTKLVLVTDLMLSYSIKIILIAIFVYLFMAPNISKEELVSMCSDYEKHQYQNNDSTVFSSEDMTNVCERREEINRRNNVALFRGFMFLVFIFDFALTRVVAKIVRNTKRNKNRIVH